MQSPHEPNSHPSGGPSTPAPPPMPGALRDLLAVLRQHPGRQHAIRMPDLWEAWTGKTLRRDADTYAIVEDVPTVTRHMRDLIDVLRDVYGIPVMSSSHYGYWMVADGDELAGVITEFRSRGLKSLSTAARLQKISLVDAVQQLGLDLRDTDSALSVHLRRRQRRHDIAAEGDLILSPEARLAAITAHLSDMLADPQTYAEQLAHLREQFGPRLIPRTTYRAIEAQIDAARLEARRFGQQLDELRALLPAEEAAA